MNEPLDASLGLLCHLDDACVSNPCQKGALCDTNPVNGHYICTCPQGHKGADCTEDVDECAMGEFLCAVCEYMNRELDRLRYELTEGQEYTFCHSSST